MKNSFVTLVIVLFLVVIGCNLPLATRKEEIKKTSPEVQDKDSQENEKLKEKIAELEKAKLEKKIEDLETDVENQKKRTPTKAKTVSPRVPKGFVRVNTPGDGYLALRTAPSSVRGQRILKIPHGTLITVYNCGGITITSGSRGRWCQTVYEDNQGWVFDAYLIK